MSYGTLNQHDATNTPGARFSTVGWIDSSGHFWLFGGTGYDNNGALGKLNDLWRWDGSQWTWISGSSGINQSGTYGTLNTASTTNIPGARVNAVSWLDSSGDFWLFGGEGLDTSGGNGELNDLWRWDGTQWTWISGSDSRNAAGVYGTVGSADSANVPGGREGAVSWVDVGGNLWLFGGIGKDSSGATGNLNDLWRWDGSNWTWVSGSNITNQAGTYGTQQITAASNTPGSRNSSISWTDNRGDFWLFGGFSYDSSGNIGSLSDLWHWNGNEWRWMFGSSAMSEMVSYGTLNQHDATNTPGARFSTVGWIDSSNQLWLFGGADTSNYFSDLWQYEP